MRTEKELWELVLSRPDLFNSGLCHWIRGIYLSNLISDDERLYLNRVVSSLRNSQKFYWIGSCFELQPRIDWINERIKEL